MITREKVSALFIFMHRILKTHFDIVESGEWKQFRLSENLNKEIHDKHVAFINNELKEQYNSFVSQDYTLGSLDGSLKNISHNRIFYYYSVALKQLESFSKEKKDIELGFLVISCLINLTLEKNIVRKYEPVFDDLIRSYREIGVSREEINKTIDLADKIIEVVSEANYALMMKKNIKKRRKKR